MPWNILIVDDSSLTRKRIKRIIEMANIDVGQFLDAENGEEALKILEKSNVDLVLSDLNMPEMGGAEMVHQMRSRGATKSIPVVVISTESKTARIKELLAEGVKDYLHKPFTQDEDLIAICECLVQNNFRRVPIVSDGKLVGIISRKDIIKYILEPIG